MSNLVRREELDATRQKLTVLEGNGIKVDQTLDGQKVSVNNDLRAVASASGPIVVTGLVAYGGGFYRATVSPEFPPSAADSVLVELVHIHLNDSISSTTRLSVIPQNPWMYAGPFP